MNCEIIKDLLPLYVDGCCSPESRSEVEAHLKTCPDCANAMRLMESTPELSRTAVGLPRRVREWRGSLLQSLCLLLAFAVITVGVSMEAATGAMLAINGFWALVLVIPATGLLLSLVNWYFVRFYRSRSRFCMACGALTFALCLCGYLWAMVHYGFTPEAMLHLKVIAPWLLSAAVSLGASFAYAAMIGKD